MLRLCKLCPIGHSSMEENHGLAGMVSTGWCVHSLPGFEPPCLQYYVYSQILSKPRGSPPPVSFPFLARNGDLSKTDGDFIETYSGLELPVLKVLMCYHRHHLLQYMQKAKRIISVKLGEKNELKIMVYDWFRSLVDKNAIKHCWSGQQLLLQKKVLWIILP
jgi:hypothetical protein